jgi:(S)-mandelate dehydrogenase
MRRLLNVEDWREAARRRLPRLVFDYVDGGAEDGVTMRANRDDFERIGLLPRVLRSTVDVSTSTEVFGRPWRSPIAVAPMGLNALTRPHGDILLAKAAAAHGVPFVLSTASNARLEDVRAAVPDADLWLQLYVLQDQAISEQLLRRAAAAGYTTLVLTVDVAVSGLRERDLRNGFSLPFKVSPRLAADFALHPAWSVRQVLAGRPAFVNLVERVSGPMSPEAQAALLSRAMDQSLDWPRLRALRNSWPGRMLLKGVLHPLDARAALEHGVDGLIVSNHGGRQLDGAVSSIAALPDIVAEVQGRIPVLLDSGIRRGVDVAKAMALGAAAVLVGRPLLYGLAVAGESGSLRVLSGLTEELKRCMTLLGAAKTEELADVQTTVQTAVQTTAASRFTR